MNRTLALLPVLVLALCSASWAELTRGPYLQLAHENGITIAWRVVDGAEDPSVLYWQEGSKDVRTCRGNAILRRTLKSDLPLSKAPKGTVQYEAHLTGLAPGRSYRYTIYDGETQLTEPSPDYRFKTHPPRALSAPARIWVVGDSGTGEAHQRLVHEAMVKYTAKTRPLDFYLHVGDMAYGQGTDDQFQKKFFEPYQETLRNTVCWASMGNHEGHSSDGKKGVGPFYDAYVCPARGEAGGLPSRKESYYSFDYGEIHFICLNSHDISRKPDGDMAKWLKRDLAATEARWIIGFWHHPPYTKGTHDSDKEVQLVEMRKYIMPILEDGGVDLVLSGHSHIYERSMLIDRAYATPTRVKGVILDDGDGRPDGDGPYRKSAKTTPHNGTVAVVTGHGGALGRNSKGIMPIMRSIVLDHGSTILDIKGDTLTGTMLDLRGKERDRFAIVKRGVVEHGVVYNPWKASKATEERTGAGVLGAPKTVAAAEKARKAGERNVPKLMPEKVSHIIEPNAEWDYLGGDEPETEMWTQTGFDPREEEWKSANAGFGFGDGDDRTVLKKMKNKYTVLFIRREFELPSGADRSKLGLVINYDDAFVLHVNGRELLRKKFKSGKKGKLEVVGHEASGAEYFSLREFADAFKPGTNVIAIEGHNVKKDSSDFTLDPYLVIELE